MRALPEGGGEKRLSGSWRHTGFSCQPVREGLEETCIRPPLRRQPRADQGRPCLDRHVTRVSCLMAARHPRAQAAGGEPTLCCRLRLTLRRLPSGRLVSGGAPSPWGVQVSLPAAPRVRSRWPHRQATLSPCFLSSWAPFRWSRAQLGPLWDQVVLPAGRAFAAPWWPDQHGTPFQGLRPAAELHRIFGQGLRGLAGRGPRLLPGVRPTVNWGWGGGSLTLRPIPILGLAVGAPWLGAARGPP